MAVRKSKVSRKSVEAAAVLASQRAASIMRKYYERGVSIRFKGDVDLVTQADVESQKAIISTLLKAFPDHLILAEEDQKSHNQKMDGPIWIVDPVDGTTNYAHGFPMFGVSIAYREGGRTEFGLVYHPLLKERFVAHRGLGTTRNGKKIQVSQIKHLSRSLLATGFPYDRRVSPENNLNYFCRFEMVSQCVRRAGAASIDLGFVACGRLDGFWEAKLGPWDIAAGMLLIEEAGGKVTDYSGHRVEDFWIGELVASNGHIHDKMLEELAIAKPSRIEVPNLRFDLN